MQGYLQKKGYWNTFSWKKRYFIYDATSAINADRILYFASQVQWPLNAAGGELKGFISLRNSRAWLKEPKIIAIDSKDANRVFELFSENEAEIEQWFLVIQRAIRAVNGAAPLGDDKNRSHAESAGVAVEKATGLYPNLGQRDFAANAAAHNSGAAAAGASEASGGNAQQEPPKSNFLTQSMNETIEQSQYGDVMNFDIYSSGYNGSSS